MKLPNGFGSHRYVYSPILLDSQVANSFYLSTGSSARRSCCQSCYYYTYQATLVSNGMEMRTTSSASLVAAGAAPEDNYGDRSFADGQWKCRLACTWFLLHVPVLILCLWDGGFLQWGMENVVLDRRPRCGRRWQRPAFTSVFGGQCANGGDNGGRKDTDQPLSEDLMHNKTSSALSCMAKMPRFLKGA